MIITRTPYRISFFGGGTDYPEWFNEHGGAVLGTTIDKYCWIVVRPRTIFGPKYKIVYSKVEECDRLEDIQHPAVRECLRFVGVDGAEIYHTSDLPARSGVGSSSAFVVGLLHALHEMNGNGLGKVELAEQATKIEREILGENVGCQDQRLTSIGGFRKIVFPSPVEFSTRWYEEGCRDWNSVRWLQKCLMLYYTGVQRNSSDIVSTYINNLKDKTSEMLRLREMVDEGIKYIDQVDVGSFGKLLDGAWRIKRSLGEAISNTDLDMIYFIAKKAGAYGGKVLGGGGGGFMLFCVPPEKQFYVREALTGLIEVPFKFEYGGSKVICNGVS